MYLSSVLENTVSFNILTVSATDEDSATNNNRVQYTFSGMRVYITYMIIYIICVYIDDLQYPGRFVIDPNNGTIRSVVQLVSG